MIRLALGILTAALGHLAAGLLCLSLVLVWRLSQGPIELDLFAPYVEDIISRGPLDLEIGRTVVRWRGLDRPLGLTAREVHVIGDDGRDIAEFPELTVSLDLKALLRGELLVGGVELVGPVITVVRDEPGSISFSIADTADGAEATDGAGEANLDEIMAAVLSPPTDGQPFSSLRRLNVVDGVLLVDDRYLGLVWEATDTDIQAIRSATGIEGQIGLSVDLGGRTARQEMSALYRFDDRRTVATLRFRDLVVSALADRFTVLAPLTSIDTVFSGRVITELDPDFIPVETRYDIESSAGVLHLEPLFPEPLAVTSMSLAGTADLERGVAEIEELAIDLGGPRLGGLASLHSHDGVLDMVGTLSLYDVPIDELATYWPQGLSPGGRAWALESLRGGMLSSASATFQLRAPADDLTAMEAISLSGGLRVEDTALTFLPEMPPVAGATTDAVFDMDSLVFTVTGGDLEDLSITEGEVTIAAFDQPIKTIDIEVVAEGPLRTALQILDLPPLGYISEIGLDPAIVTGDIAARLRFEFPLTEIVPFDTVAIAASAFIEQASLGSPLADLPIERLNGRLDLDGRGLTFTGTGALSGVDVTAEWQERFTTGEDFLTRLVLAGTLDAGALEPLGLPEEVQLSGPIPVEATFVDIDRQQQTLALTIALDQAAIAIDPIGWTKAPGQAASLQATLDLGPEGLVGLPRLDLQSADLEVGGSLRFIPRTGALAAAEVETFRYAGSVLSGSLERAVTGGYLVRLSGPRINAVPWLDRLAGDAGEDETAEEPPSMPLHIAVATDEVVLGEGRSLFGVEVTLVRDEVGWRDLDVGATTAGNGTVAVRYQVDDQGLTGIWANTDNLGQVLAALDVYDGVEGGTLAAVGRQDHGDGPILGDISLTDVRLREAPLLARILAALSLGGLQEVLGSEGLRFNRVVSNFGFADDILELRNARGSGGALGLTLEGAIDVGADTADLQGTIVPIYGINSALSEIPLLGDVLTGGDGQGIIAFTYGVNGPLDDPEISVNPLSVLAPGLLRNVFFLESQGDLEQMGDDGG